MMQEIVGSTSYVSLVANVVDRDSTALVFSNLSKTINQIEYTVLSIIILMALLIILLISLLIVNDFRNLGGILKALGYRDHVNITSFLSIYIPVLLLSVLISIPITLGMIAVLNSIIFNGVGIFLTTKLSVIDVAIGIAVSLPAFMLS
jgi:putative ABC transport system permease protein